MTTRSSIRGILLFILLVAMLPIMFLSTWQGLARINRDSEALHQQLLEAAQLANSSDLNVVSSARALLGLLAESASVRARTPGICDPILQVAARGFPAVSQIAVSASDGSLVCASSPDASKMPRPEPGLWQTLQASDFLVTTSERTLATDTTTLHARLPLRTANGIFDGAITASIDLAWLQRQLRQRHARNDIVVALVDGTGRPVAHSQPLPWGRLTLTTPRPDENRDQIRSQSGPGGERWSYVVAPLPMVGSGANSLHIVYASVEPARFGSEWWFAAGYFLLPPLALMLASAAIWFGANRAILRWVSHLSLLARQIGNTGRPSRLKRSRFADAPTEVRDLAAELLRMSNTIVDREQRLRRSVDTQTSVALELHHRVRNNLQVMASFLSLQAEDMPTDEARRALEDARLRVSTMAMVNGLLYADAEVASISKARLLGPIGELLSRHMGIEAKVHIGPQVVPRFVDIDRAMPISLWIVEAAICLFERADPDHKPTDFMISIDHEEEVMCIIVTMQGLLPDSSRHSLHRRLVVAIAHQLGGRCRIDDAGASAGKIVLCLPNDELSA